MRRFIPIVILVMTALAIGQVPPPAAPPEDPHSPAAIEAKRKYDLTIKIAREAYDKAAVAADQQYITNLEACLKTAMNDGPSAVEEVKRLDAARVTTVDQLHDDLSEDTAMSPRWKITSAVWGTDTKQIDVVKKIKIKECDISFKRSDLGDPAFGEHKTLIIRGKFGDVPFAMEFRDAEIGDFELQCQVP